MVEFIKQGHRVYFLNQQENEYLPTICKNTGVHYETIPPPTSTSTIIRTLYYCMQLFRFVGANRINIVYSHLEPANFIAVLTQFFISAKIIIVRHHHDLAARAGFGSDLSYKMTYQLARKIITVSEATKNYMVVEEGFSAEKIFPIRLGYDFSIFGSPNELNVKKLKEKLKDSVVLITVGRLDEYKRPMLSFEVCKALNRKGIKSHLFFLGVGEFQHTLQEEVHRCALENAVSFIGYADNVLDYLAVSDWLLHPSISESSCVVVKEAGLVELPAIVCKGVGDFDYYLLHGQNSFLVDPHNFIEESVQTISDLVSDQSARKKLGIQLKKDVLANFSISAILPQYERFH